MQQILKYIDNHLDEAISTKQLAGIAGYSEYHFIRLFKAYTNSTVTDYVCRRKLIKASEDIINGRRIIDVALDYSWQSHSGFTKAFNREFGFSPSLLRAMVIEIKSIGGSAMDYVFMQSTPVGATKEELFALLQGKLKENKINYNEDELASVYKYACKSYEGVKRYSGEEYVTHTINVALLLAELEANIEVILAGMFCDVSIKGVISLDNLSDKLPQELFSIIKEVQESNQSLENASYEVILIKMAERLHNMRTIEFMDESRVREKAKETLDVFMPIARKLGNKKLLDEMNDLTMKY